MKEAFPFAPREWRHCLFLFVSLVWRRWLWQDVLNVLFVYQFLQCIFTMRKIQVLPKEISYNSPLNKEENDGDKHEVNIWRREEGYPNVPPKVNQMFHYLLILFPRCSCSPFVQPPGSSSTRTECEILFLRFIVSFAVRMSFWSGMRFLWKCSGAESI